MFTFLILMDPLISFDIIQICFYMQKKFDIKEIISANNEIIMKLALIVPPLKIPNAVEITIHARRKNRSTIAN